MNQIDWKELWKKCFGKEKDERAHAIAMLAIYGIFIIILIIVVRTGGTTTENKKTIPTPSNTPNSIDQIIESNTENQDDELNKIESYDINYSYIFTVQNNDQKEILTGKRLDDKEIFTIINNIGSTNYAKLSDNYLKKENGEYHLIDPPSNNLIYTDINTIISLTEKGTLTKNNNTYTYLVPTSEVVKAYNFDTQLAVDINLNDTIIVTSENGVIKTININFNNYQTVLNSNIPAILMINMEFNNVGTTENFEVTISN